MTGTGLWYEGYVLDRSRTSTGGRSFSSDRRAGPRENTGDRASRLSGLGSSASDAGKISGEDVKCWGGMDARAGASGGDQGTHRRL